MPCFDKDKNASAVATCWTRGKMSLLGRVLQHCSRCPRRQQHLQPCQDGQIEPLQPQLLLVDFIFEEKAAPPAVSTNQHKLVSNSVKTKYFTLLETKYFTRSSQQSAILSGKWCFLMEILDSVLSSSH